MLKYGKHFIKRVLTNILCNLHLHHINFYDYIHDHGIDGGNDFPLFHEEVEDNAVEDNPGHSNGSVQEPGVLKRVITLRTVLRHVYII